MLAGSPVPVFGDGSSRRDYTYIADIVAGVRSALAYDRSMYEVINLGNNQTVQLIEMVHGLERALGVEAQIARLPEQPGDVPQTWARIDRAAELLGYAPRTPFAEGLAHFARWVRQPHETAAAAAP